MGCGSSVPKRVAPYDYDAIIQDFENKLLRPLPSQCLALYENTDVFEQCPVDLQCLTGLWIDQQVEIRQLR